MLLPVPQRVETGGVLHDEIKVQSEEHRHPGLGELVVLPRDESPCERLDEL